MSTPKRVALIGCGRMGSRHAETVARHLGSTLVIAIDTDISKAQACAARHECEAATQLETEVDIAIVATPSHAHHSETTRALSHATWCLVEKPFLLPGERLEHPRVLVSHPERFHGSLTGLTPSELTRFQSTRESPPPSPAPYDDVFLDLLVHDLDLLCQWAVPLSLLDAQCSRSSGGSIESGMARYELPHGGIATLRVSRVASERKRTLEWTSRGRTTHVDLANVPKGATAMGSLDRQWDAVLKTMRGETPRCKPATCDDGALVVALAAQARHHATQHSKG